MASNRDLDKVPSSGLEELSPFEELMRRQRVDSFSLLGGSTEEMLKSGVDLLAKLDSKYVSGLSNEEYKLRILDLEKKRKLDDHVFDCRMRELERRRKSYELALKIFDANVNLESGVNDKSGFAVIDRRLGITTMGRKVLRLRGGASDEEGLQIGDCGQYNIVESSMGKIYNEAEDAVTFKKDVEVFRLRGGMASQGSNCDSDGVPDYMRDFYGEDDTDILLARREVEDFPILVSSDLNDGKVPKEDEFPKDENVTLNRDDEGNLTPRSAKRWVEEYSKQTSTVNLEAGVIQSSSGGIPVERVEVEDYVSSDDEVMHDTAQAAMERLTVSRAAKLAFAENKRDREELFKIRAQWQRLDGLLKKKGISLVDLEKEQIVTDSRFNIDAPDMSRIMSGRDEFGLPSFKPLSNEAPAKQESIPAKENIVDLKGILKKTLNFDSKASVSGAKDETGTEKEAGIGAESANKAKSWANVVKEEPRVKFDYYPVDSNSGIVEPPLEVLQRGNDKFKNCVVGTFTKGTQPLRKVIEFVDNFWKRKGLENVYQKDASTFVFKFAENGCKNAFLSRGTWYVGQRPMVVTAWGVKPGENNIDTMPLWIKLSNIPICYWTEEGLGRLASAIGKPVGADALTSKLDMIPFAKMCVQYTIGNPLPNEIKASVLDPVTNEISTEIVQVSYPFKPLVCEGCKSLGHTAAVCPKVKRIWVLKEKSSEAPPQPVVDDNNKEKMFEGPMKGDGKPNQYNVETPASKDGISESCNTPAKEEEWTEVKRKGRSPDARVEEFSPSPPVTFKNLKSVDEVELRKVIANTSGGSGSAPKMSRKKQKRQRNSLGKASPSLSK